MGQLQTALTEFSASANRIADYAGYDTLRVGVVVANWTPLPQVVGLDVSLLWDEGDSIDEHFESSRLAAAVAFLPRTEISRLVEALAGGTFPPDWSKRFAGKWNVPENATIGDVNRTGAWFMSDSSLGDERGASLRISPADRDLRSLIGSRRREMDQEVAEASSYRYVGFNNLMLRFCNDGASDPGSDWNLSVPWPVKILPPEVVALGPSLFQVTVKVAPTRPDRLVDPGRLVATIETKSGRNKVTGSGEAFERRPQAGQRGLLATTVMVSNSAPTGVRVFVRGVPDIALQAQASDPRESVWSRLSTSDDRAKPPEPIRSNEFAVGRVVGLELKGFRLHVDSYVDLAVPPSDDEAEPTQGPCGLTAVIGPNQGGKSSLVHAVQLLRAAAIGDLSRQLAAFGPVSSLANRAAATREFTLGAVMEIDGQRLRYRLTLRAHGGLADDVEREELDSWTGHSWMSLFEQNKDGVIFEGKRLNRGGQKKAILSSDDAAAEPLLRKIRSTLSGISTFPWFNVGAGGDFASPIRAPTKSDEEAVLSPTGANLPAVLARLHAIRPKDFAVYIERLRLAFPRLVQITFPPAGGSFIVMKWWESKSGADHTPDVSFDAGELSDGTLQYMCALATVFEEGTSLVVIDEPELHLHPGLVHLLVGALLERARLRPILLLTQSNHVLSALQDSPEAIAVCQREGGGSRVLRPPPGELADWSRKFNLGELRSEIEGWGLGHAN